MPPNDDTEKLDRWKRSGLETYDGKWAETYDSCIYWRIFSSEKWDNAVIDFVGTLPRDSRILDVGCATGRLLEALAKAGMRELSGVDIAPRIVQTAKNRLRNVDTTVDLRVADAEIELPWPDASFDVVSLTGVLHHFSHPNDALAEIWRVLKKKGRLIVLEPNFLIPARQLANLFLRFFPSNGDYHFYSPKGAGKLLEKCKFTVTNQSYITWHTFLIIGQKA